MKLTFCASLKASCLLFTIAPVLEAKVKFVNGLGMQMGILKITLEETETYGVWKSKLRLNWQLVCSQVHFSVI